MEVHCNAEMSLEGEQTLYLEIAVGGTTTFLNLAVKCTNAGTQFCQCSGIDSTWQMQIHADHICRSL